MATDFYFPSPHTKALGYEKILPNYATLNKDLQALFLHHMQQLKRDSGRRFWPISHFCTVDTLVFNSAANTTWLTCEASRIYLISSGRNCSIGGRH